MSSGCSAWTLCDLWSFLTNIWLWYSFLLKQPLADANLGGLRSQLTWLINIKNSLWNKLKPVWRIVEVSEMCLVADICSCSKTISLVSKKVPWASSAKAFQEPAPARKPPWCTFPYDQTGLHWAGVCHRLLTGLILSLKQDYNLRSTLKILASSYLPNCVDLKPSYKIVQLPRVCY